MNTTSHIQPSTSTAGTTTAPAWLGPAVALDAAVSGINGFAYLLAASVPLRPAGRASPTCWGPPLDSCSPAAASVWPGVRCRRSSCSASRPPRSSGPAGVDPIALMPFAEATGIVVDAASPDVVTGHLDWSEDRCTTGGVLHGGAPMTLADTVGAVCAFLGLPERAGTATTSSSSQLLRPVTEGSVTATSRPLHRGRTQVVVRTELHDDRGRMVGHTVQAQAVL